MPIITRKIELMLDRSGLTEEQSREQYRVIYNINDHLYQMANRLISGLYLANEIDQILRLSDKQYVDLRKKISKRGISDEEKVILEGQMAEVLAQINERRSEILNRTQQSFAYSVVTEGETYNVGAKILDTLKQNVLSHFKSDTKEVTRGEKSLSTYRKGMPIPFPFNETIRIEKDENGWYILKWFSGIKFILNFGRDRSNNELIVARSLGLRDDEVKYKLCTSSIQIKKKDNHTKIFLLLCVDIPSEQVKYEKDKVLGIDLGLNVPIYAASNNSPERKAIGSRETFLNQRGAFQRRYKALQRLQSTQGGRGRLHKLEALERLRNAERNWVRTQNHIFSKEVVEYAKSIRAGTIQMEKLANFGKDKQGEVYDDKKYVLRNWSYFELQNLIEYKAKMAGIKVRYINPAFTSQTCNECGQVGVRDSIHFKCINPDCKCFGDEHIHADYNGARNIAKSKDILKE